MSEEKGAWKSRFFDRLGKLTNGEKASLKRSIGLRMQEAKGEAIATFYKVIPKSELEKGGFFEEKLFLIATLWSFHRYASKSEISFGTTLRLLRNSDSFDKKVYALIDSKISPEDGELAYRMAQVVRMADSEGVKIYWEKLLDDLMGWEWETRAVQRNWARDYFKDEKQNTKGGSDDE